MLKIIAGLFLLGAMVAVVKLVLMAFEAYPEVTLWVCSTPFILIAAYLVGGMVVPEKKAKSEEESYYERR